MGWLTPLHEPERDYGIWSIHMLTHKTSKGLLLVSIFSLQWRNGLRFYCLHYHRIKVVLLTGHQWPVNQSTNSGLAAFLSVFLCLGFDWAVIYSDVTPWNGKEPEPVCVDNRPFTPIYLGAHHHVRLWLVPVGEESVCPVLLAYNLLGQNCCWIVWMPVFCFICFKMIKEFFSTHPRVNLKRSPLSWYETKLTSVVCEL